MLQILGNSIATAIRNAEEASESQRTFLETTAHLIRNIEDLYPQMRGHSRRVTGIALEMGRRLGQTEFELETLRFGALLHDLGELDRYSELMEDGCVLTDDERRKLRQESAARGESLLGGGKLGRVGDVLRHHQEHWDGSGFPDRLRGLEIPLAARIVAIANAWDALLHDRPHRPAFSEAEARGIVEQRAGEQFDPDLVLVLFETVASLRPSPPSAQVV
jgi:HD-GYP domain-containing protein (c-di-GMP phosphodiesterase class II)